MLLCPADNRLAGRVDHIFVKSKNQIKMISLPQTERAAIGGRRPLEGEPTLKTMGKLGLLSTTALDASCHCIGIDFIAPHWKLPLLMSWLAESQDGKDQTVRPKTL